MQSCAPVLITSSYSPHVGGVEEVVRRLGEGLHHHGAQPVIITNRWPKHLPREAVLEGLPVWRPVFRVPEPNWRQLGGWALTSLATELWLHRKAKERRCDLVNVHCVSSNGRYALDLHRRLDVPLIVSVHGELTGDANDVYSRSPQLRRTLRKLLAAASAVTAPTRAALRDVEEFAGSPCDKGVVIANGVDIELFAKARESAAARKGVVAVGRLVAVKQFDVLIKAFDLAARHRPSAVLRIVGDGPERQALESLAKRLPTAARIEFLGVASQAEVAAHMAAADLFVLPSSHEAMGLTILEAMAAGTPVIASRVGGVPEVVDHERTGLLVQSGDVDALAAAIGKLLDDSRLRARLAAHASPHVQAFSWASCVRGYMDVYSTALEGY
jgi:glycogen(starch) synthase